MIRSIRPYVAVWRMCAYLVLSPATWSACIVVVLLSNRWVLPRASGVNNMARKLGGWEAWAWLDHKVSSEQPAEHKVSENVHLYVVAEFEHLCSLTF